MRNIAGRLQNCEQATVSFVVSVRLSSLKFVKLAEDDTCGNAQE